MSYTDPHDKLPDNNPKTAMGVLKPSLVMIPPGSLIYLGEVMAHGAAKYGRYNWREDNITRSTYQNAALRHLLADIDGERLDPESGFPHWAHVMANAAVVLDATFHQTIREDEFPVGRTGDLIAALTKKA
jgi:hypothetical protein